MSGHVVCCGRHGATVRGEDGEHHRVRWERVLGHKKRADRAVAVIDRGEDGAICEDETGKRFYLHGALPDPDEPDPESDHEPELDDEPEPGDEREEPDMKKSIILFTNATGHRALRKAIANAPGLALRETTDKRGHQTKRWMKIAPDEKKGREPGRGEQDRHQEARRKVVGRVVPFTAGSFKGKGEVIAAGRDGVTVKDSEGREHQVHWHELHAGEDVGSEDAKQDAQESKEPEFGTSESLFSDADSANLPVKANQPVNDPDKLWEMSEEALKDYTAFLTGVSESLGIEKMTKSPDDVDFSKPGGMLFIAPLKGKQRAKEKVENKYGGDWSRLCDVVRATIAVDTMDELKGLVAKLKEHGLELAAAPEDRFYEPTPVGYGDVMLNVKLSNGIVGELQLHVKPMLEAKNEGHKPYEVIRRIAESGPESEWSDEDRKAYENAVAESKRIYGAAWAKLRGSGDKNNGPEKMTKSLSSSKIILLFRRKANER